MSAVIIPEELLASDVVLPEQFDDIWHRTRFISSERALALAVLWQVVIDLERFRFAPRRRQQRMYMEAYKWVASDACDWPYAFASLCEMLGLSPGALRAQLLGRETRIQAADTVGIPTKLEKAA